MINAQWRLDMIRLYYWFGLWSIVSISRPQTDLLSTSGTIGKSFTGYDSKITLLRHFLWLKTDDKFGPEELYKRAKGEGLEKSSSPWPLIEVLYFSSVLRCAHTPPNLT